MEHRWLLATIVLYLARGHLCFEAFNETYEPTDVKQLEANVEDMVNSIAKWIFPLALRVTESNVSMPCRLSLLRLFKDFTKIKGWAFRMLDASGKLQSGLLQGTLVAFGDYDECIDITVTNFRRKTIFEGKYCMIGLRLPEFVISHIEGLNATEIENPIWMTLSKFVGFGREVPLLSMGVCIPSTCTERDVHQVVHMATRSLALQASVRCQTKVTREPNTEQLVFLCIFALIASLVVIGTFVDVFKQHTRMKIKSGEMNKFLIAFSLYSNTIRLFRTVQYDSTLSALRGCRVLMAFWIILGHIYFFPHDVYFLKYRRLIGLTEFVGEFMFKTVTNTTVAVDTFFLLSGMMFVYTNWRKIEKNKGWINPLTYFPVRMARIIPIETLVIALFMLLPLFGNGPIWNETFKESYANCRKNWWTNLLFIQNFWPLERICLFHTWFIGALFQLFALSFGVILILYRWPRLGISINLLLIVTSCCVTGLMTSLYNVPSYFSVVEKDVDVWRRYFDIIYSRPYTYFSSYCIGVLLGYVVVTEHRPKIKPRIQFTCWLLSVCGALVVLYGMNFLDKNSHRELNILYAAVHRMIWSSAVAWTLFACITGYGGVIGRLLSWKGMIPLDRIVLWVYLLHPLVLYYYTARTRAVIYMSHVEQVYIYLATTVITLILSYIFNVTFEQPLKYIEARIIGMFSKSPSPDIVRETIIVPSAKKLASLPEITVTPAEPTQEEDVSSKL